MSQEEKQALRKAKKAEKAARVAAALEKKEEGTAPKGDFFLLVLMCSECSY